VLLGKRWRLPSSAGQQESEFYVADEMIASLATFDRQAKVTSSRTFASGTVVDLVRRQKSRCFNMRPRLAPPGIMPIVSGTLWPFQCA
jgi:hypothetical protein